MGLRVALLSGGKDSLYAAYLEKPIDLGLLLVYEFPRPSPHLVNLAASVHTLNLAGIPVVVHRLRRGRELEDTARLLRALGADTIVAGDVYVEDHLRYMERLASEAGAELREPLWGRNPLDILYAEVEAGFRAKVIGAEEGLAGILGLTISPETVDRVVEAARRAGADPLGERGEYHTVVVSSPLHARPLECRELGVEEYGGYRVLRLGC